MLKYLRKHRSIGHVALVAIAFNVLVQVNCCIEFIEASTPSNTSEVSGFWAEARASLCVHAETEAASEKHLAAFDEWAASMEHSGSNEHSGHDNHDAGACQCLPGVCGQLASVIPGFAESSISKSQIASTALPGIDDIVSETSFTTFSARGPPLELLI
jgi:hypothetical protein